MEIFELRGFKFLYLRVVVNGRYLYLSIFDVIFFKIIKIFGGVYYGVFRIKDYVIVVWVYYLYIVFRVRRFEMRYVRDIKKIKLERDY